MTNLKKLLAVSHATYRSITIFELEDGFSFFLGLMYCKYHTLQEATDRIDIWLNLRIN